MNKKCFVFCHGFGFDASFWVHLKPYFAHEQAVYLDVGYFGQDDMTVTVEPGVDYIGIGHSMGLMKLMSLNLPFSALIGLHGFVNFLGFDTALNHQRTRELARLRQHVARAPVATLNYFHQQVGVGPYVFRKAALNQKKLLDDLDLLAHAVDIRKNIPMLILGSCDDKIVPPALIEDNYAHHLHITVDMLNQASHALGYLKPDVVYQKIMRFIYAC